VLSALPKKCTKHGCTEVSCSAHCPKNVQSVGVPKCRAQRTAQKMYKAWVYRSVVLSALPKKCTKRGCTEVSCSAHCPKNVLRPKKEIAHRLSGHASHNLITMPAELHGCSVSVNYSESHSEEFRIIEKLLLEKTASVTEIWRGYITVQDTVYPITCHDGPYGV